MWTRTTTADVGGVEVDLPDLTSLTVHAGVHAVLGEAWPQPENLRDVATALHHPDADLGSTLALASTWQAETVLAFAIGAAWTELALDREHPAARWATAHRPTRRDLRRIDPYLVDRRDDARGRPRRHAGRSRAGRIGRATCGRSPPRRRGAPTGSAGRGGSTASSPGRRADERGPSRSPGTPPTSHPLGAAPHGPTPTGDARPRSRPLGGRHARLGEDLLHPRLRSLEARTVGVGTEREDTAGPHRVGDAVDELAVGGHDDEIALEIVGEL